MYTFTRIEWYITRENSTDDFLVVLFLLLLPEFVGFDLLQVGLRRRVDGPAVGGHGTRVAVAAGLAGSFVASVVHAFVGHADSTEGADSFAASSDEASLEKTFS